MGRGAGLSTSVAPAGPGREPAAVAARTLSQPGPAATIGAVPAAGDARPFAEPTMRTRLAALAGLPLLIYLLVRPAPGPADRDADPKPRDPELVKLARVFEAADGIDVTGRKWVSVESDGDHPWREHGWLLARRPGSPTARGRPPPWRRWGRPPCQRSGGTSPRCLRTDPGPRP